jgi:hypothetical protein
VVRLSLVRRWEGAQIAVLLLLIITFFAVLAYLSCGKCELVFWVSALSAGALATFAVVTYFKCRLHPSLGHSLVCE